MIERRGYENRLEPSPEQTRLLLKFVGSRRWVWNWALALQKERLEAGLPLFTYVELAKLLTSKRHEAETAWLAEGPVHTQQAALRDLSLALDRWRQRTSRFPRFKKKGRNESIRYPDCKQIKFDFSTRDQDGRTRFPKIFLPKLGWIPFRLSRALVGKVCNATVRYRSGHWHVSVQTECEICPEPIPQTEDNTIGGDIGICQFLTLSDGSVVETPAHFKNKEAALQAAQRKLARMKRGSKRYNEQRKRIQRLHGRVAAARKDFLHQVSATLSKKHAFVKLEDVSLRKMVKTRESEPDGQKQTRVMRARFNRSLLAVGWGMFLHFLDYKLRVRGGGLILVNPAYSSQECAACSSIQKGNRLTRDRFRCLACDHADHADANAAKVIKKRAGHARFACRDSHTGDLP